MTRFPHDVSFELFQRIIPRHRRVLSQSRPLNRSPARMVLALIVGLTGCAADFHSLSASPTASGPDEMRNLTGSTTGIAQPIAIVLGEWHGVYHCQGGQYVINLKVSNPGGTNLQAAMAIKVFTLDGKPYRVPGNETEESLQGTYHPDLSLFTLRTQRAKNPRTNLGFVGVVDPDSGRLAAVLQPNPDKCSYLIAGRNDMKREVDAMVKHATGPYTRSKLRDDQRCDQRLADWLMHPLAYEQFSQGLQDQNFAKYGALELAQDANFVRYFGKGFGELSASEIGDMEYQVAHGCWQKFTRSERPTSISSVLSLLRNEPAVARPELAIYARAKPVILNWKRRAVAALDVASLRDSQELTRAGANILPLLWPIGEYDIRNDVLAKQNSASSMAMLAELKTLTDQPQPDFLHLARLATFTENTDIGKTSFASAPRSAKEQREANIKERQEDRGVLRYRVTPESLRQAEELVRRTIDQQVLSTAEPFARSSATVEHVLVNLGALASGPQRALVKYLDAAKQTQIDAIFRARKTALLAEFANRETTNFEAQTRVGSATLVDLQRINDNETQLRQRYQTLLQESAFAALNSKQRQYKDDLLARNLEVLKTHLVAASSVHAMDQMLQTYLQPGEIKFPGVASLARVYQERTLHFAPFTGLEGGEYLNAIYSDDLAEVRRHDSAYANNLRRVTTEFMGANNFRSKLLDTKYDRVTLVNPILATYLFNYQKNFKACLAADAVAFTVTEKVPGTVTTNGLGVELYRTFGYTNEYHYTVNKEFAGIFRQIGADGSGNVMLSLLDIFVNHGKLDQIKQGVSQMMDTNRFPCNGRVIQNMEQRMREIFYKVNQPGVAR